ncbi:MAG: dUTP diphosphatase [bacterium]|nr:dUTP diphosphatase [bacterium]
MKIEIQKLSKNATLPNYAHEHDAGMDLYSANEIEIPPHSRVLVPTGIAVAISEGYVGLIWDKSGIATKNGITTLAGVIDAGYRGEINVLVHNLSDTPYLVGTRNKIAQMLIQPVITPEIIETEALSSSDRGDKGFGSSGI